MAEMVGRLAVKRVIYILAVRSTRKPAGSPQKLNTSWQHTAVEDRLNARRSRRRLAGLAAHRSIEDRLAAHRRRRPSDGSSQEKKTG